MAIVCEALGIAALGSGSVPATDPAKAASPGRSGEQAVQLAAGDRGRETFITRRAIENAIAVVAATGGSTNAVLHLLAIAKEAGVELTICRLRSHQRERHRSSQTSSLRVDSSQRNCTRRAALRSLSSGSSKPAPMDPQRPTVTGRTLAEEAATAVETPGQEVVRPIDRPLKSTGGLVILFGNLAPEGAVLKLSGTERGQLRGPARVFDSEEQAFEAVQSQSITAGDVVVIRYEGPAGGPGMREMLAVTAAIVGAGLGDSVALLTDGTVLGRHARIHGRARGARSFARRADCGYP